MADETTERVSMQWPKELKAAVRDKVGARGLTEFVLEAVEVHLNGGAEREQSSTQEVNELKWLVQQLADRAAMGGDAEQRKSALMELELPEWIDTAGWPSGIAELVTPTPMEECSNHPRTFFEVGSECRQCRREKEAQEVEEKEGPAPIAPTPAPVMTNGDDHLARVMEVARKKGVELASIDLKPASQISKPDPKPVTDEEAREAIEVMEEVVEVATGKCSTCGEELVDGECWVCF